MNDESLVQVEDTKVDVVNHSEKTVVTTDGESIKKFSNDLDVSGQDITSRCIENIPIAICVKETLTNSDTFEENKILFELRSRQEEIAENINKKMK